ncbi:MAG: RDD family protein [Bacteroidetes bacterium]|nr:RDD family protein [Bacteroidota bacterium]
MEQILDSTQSVPAHRGYAGFWLRFAAAIIDTIFLWIFQFILIMFLYGSFTNYFQSAMDPQHVFSAKYWTMILVSFFVGIGYFVGMECSAKQGTFGKSMVGIKVTNYSGEKISFLKSLGRYLSKIPSALIFAIGFIMAGFTEKKQALHDMMASTLVVKK